jgi:hypothetical protein
MKIPAFLLLALLAALCSAGAARAASLACTVTDESNPHFFTAAAADPGLRRVEVSFGPNAPAIVFSLNNAPCDQIGSDGDNEQALLGAQMPIVGATCPYAQDILNEQAGGGPVTVGHHGDDIYATNVANIDLGWSSGVDGQDPAATLAGQTCTGNGVISDDPTTDPADCFDNSGANINVLSNVHRDTDPLSIGTNDPLSGFACLDAVDGNEWTFLDVGPFLFFGEKVTPVDVEMQPSPGDSQYFVTIDLGAPMGGTTSNPECLEGVLDISDVPSDSNTSTVCTVTIDTDNPVEIGGPIGFSLPISGTVASGVEV